MTTPNIENQQVWSESKALVKLVENITKHFPKNDSIGLADQMQQSASAITTNILEGGGSLTLSHKTKFYGLAYDRLMEVLNQCVIAVDLGFLNQTTFNKDFKPLMHKMSLRLYALKNNPV